MQRTLVVPLLLATGCVCVLCACVRVGYDPRTRKISDSARDSGMVRDSGPDIVAAGNGGHAAAGNPAGAGAAAAGAAGAGIGGVGAAGDGDAAIQVDAGAPADTGAGLPPCGGLLPATRVIDLDDAQITGGPHMDFPLLVSITDDWLRSATLGGSTANDDGSDIHFSADPADSQRLDHDLELYDGANGSLVAWVRIPSLSASTLLYIQYGDCAFDATQLHPSSVWGAEYAGVWHMQGLSDATTHANDCQNSNASDLPQGKISGAKTFDGISSVLNAGSDASLDGVFADGGAITAWILPLSSGEGSLSRIMSKAGPSTPTEAGWSFYMEPSGSVYFRHSFSGASGQWSATSGALDFGHWHAVVVQYHSTSASAAPEFFIDGQPATGGGAYYATPSGTPDSDADSDLRIGNLEDTTRTFDGSIDEIRLFRGARTREWFATEYANQNDPSSFYSVNPL